MTTFTNAALGRLALVVAAMRRGAVVVSPATPPDRRGATFTDEVRIADWCGDRRALLRCAATTRDGRVLAAPATPAPWSIDDALQVVASWGEGGVHDLPAIDAAADGGAWLDALLTLDRTGSTTIGAEDHVLSEDPTTDSGLRISPARRRRDSEGKDMDSFESLCLLGT